MKLKPILFYLVISGSAFAHESYQKEIIYIGDSHSLGAFGAVYTSWFRSSEQTRFHFIASGGSAPLQWTNGLFVTSCGYEDYSELPLAPVRKCDEKFLTPKLETLYKSELGSDKLTIIALGTNFGPTPEDYKFQVKSVVNLLKTVYNQQSECLWIGPPDMKRYSVSVADLKYQIIQEGILEASKTYGKIPCQLIDSRLYSRYPETQPGSKPDGIHYDYPASWYRFPEGIGAAKAWGASVLNEIINSGI
jgi:hypothetical protein